ncbi:MAG: DUF72 domain-containing protein [Actinobacteria bacterium]|nr:DUF72 domain-containing protein [Actinomycetota bacterium]
MSSPADQCTVRVGTSGWQYDDWRGTFYPDDVAKRRWFEHYTSRFPTVEINATFYRLPKPATVERWHDRAPDRFRFAVKGSRYLTHNKKLKAPSDPVATITERMAPLKTFHGVWLWQLPPNLHLDVDRLERFLDTLPGGPGHAVEFRHRSWYVDEVEDALARHNVAWVWLSDHQMPDTCPVTADFVYLRFHGLAEDDDQRYRYDYAERELAPWAERLRSAAADGRDGWVYFNNDYQANAPRNAATQIDLLGDAAEPWD